MTVRDALLLARQHAPHAPIGALHYAVAVSTLETDNGAWPHVPAGEGSNNFGAIQEFNAANPSFSTPDVHANGKTYQGHFKKYLTEASGWADFWHTLYEHQDRHGNAFRTLEFASAGDGASAVDEQHAAGYFEANPDTYGANLARVYERVLSESGEPRSLSFKKKVILPSPSASPPSPSSGSSFGKLSTSRGAVK